MTCPAREMREVERKRIEIKYTERELMEQRE